MKVNIQKLQLGGGLGSLFSATTINQQSPTQNITSVGDDEKKGPTILSKETLNKLRSDDYGLPNELDQFEVDLMELEYKLDHNYHVDPLEIAQIRAKAGRLIAQAGHLKKAEEHAFAKNALDDVAVDHRGFIYALTKKGVERVAFSKFNPEKHQALTYSELVELRRQSPQLINDYQSISVISRATSIEETNKFIYDILDKIKESETKTEAVTTLRAIDARVGGSRVKAMSDADFMALKDIAYLADKVGLDTVFKTSQLSQNSNLQHAYNYILEMLPKNMRAQLEATYLVNGGKYKDLKSHVGELIETATMTINEQKYHYSISPETGINDANKSDTKGQQFVNLTALETLANGDAHPATLKVIGATATGVQMTLHGTGLPQLYDKNNNLLGAGTVQYVLDQGLGESSDKDGIYFGDQKIDPATLNQFLYKGEEVLKMAVPVDENGAPNTTLLKKVNEALSHCARTKMSIPDMQQYWEMQDLPGAIDDNGNFIGNGEIQVEDFYVFSGITTLATVGDIEANELAREIRKGREHENEINRINQTLADANQNKKGDAKLELPTQWWRRDSKQPLVTAPIFIKCSKNPGSQQGYGAGHGPRTVLNTYDQFVSKTQADGNIDTQTTSMLYE